MTRSLFFLTALVAMLATMTAVLIRAELAYPGVSALFSDATGQPDSAKFSTTAKMHSLFSYLAVILLGTTMGASARTKGVRVGGAFVWVGIVAATAVLAIIILSSPPFSTGALMGTAMDQAQVEALINLNNLPLLIDLTDVLMIPAAAVLFLGAFAMLSTEPGYGALPFAAFIIVTILAFLTSTMVLQAPIFAICALFILAALFFLAFAAIRLTDHPEPWLVIMTMGFLATLIAQGAMLAVATSAAARGTQIEIAQLYLFPLGMAFYALPALLIYDRPTRLPAWAPWAISAAITSGLAAWLLPLAKLGLNGQPNVYMDYPDNLAPDNLTVSTATATFILLMLAIVVMVRRARA